MHEEAITKSILNRCNTIEEQILIKPHTGINFSQQFFTLYEVFFMKTNRNLLKAYTHEDVNSTYHLLMSLLITSDKSIQFPIPKTNFKSLIKDVFENTKNIPKEEMLLDLGTIHAATISTLYRIQKTGQIKRNDIQSLAQHMTMLYRFNGCHMIDKNHLEIDKQTYQITDSLF